MAVMREMVATLAYRRGSEEAGGFKSGTLYVINGETGEIAWEYTFDPLKPYFEEVTFWRGVSVSPDGGFINVTTDDGRAFIFSTAPTSDGIKPLWNTSLTTPLEVSGIPIIATNGTIGATNDFALFVTGDTFIPYHLQEGRAASSFSPPEWDDSVCSRVVGREGVAVDIGKYAARNKG